MLDSISKSNCVVGVNNNYCVKSNIKKSDEIKSYNNLDSDCFINSKKEIVNKENSLSIIDKIKSSLPKTFHSIVDKFIKTKEGSHRLSMSDDEISVKANVLFNEAFDRLGIDKANRPILDTKFESSVYGGGYESLNHTIKFNPNFYRLGLFEIDDVIMHEATHCSEAIKRSSISNERVNEIVREQLKNKIMDGEDNQVILRYNGGLMESFTMMKAPELSDKMKKDFSNFASEYLYVKSDNLNNAFLEYNNILIMKEALNSNAGKKLFNAEKLKNKEEQLKSNNEFCVITQNVDKLLDNHPEFINQYKDRDEAFKNLLNYSISHFSRYNLFSNKDVVGIPEMKIVKEKLVNINKNDAERSLIDFIPTLEGNAAMSGLKVLSLDKKSINQYQFSPEEVLAQKNGNNFTIENYTKKLEKINSGEKSDIQDEKYLNFAIQRAKLTIKYKEKGLEYSLKQQEVLKNPKNETLKNELKNLENELTELENELKNFTKMNLN